MLGQPATTPLAAQSTPTPRLSTRRAHARSSSSSSLNPRVTKPAFLPAATFHRFRKLEHLLQPSPAAIRPRHETHAARPDSPPPSPPSASRASPSAPQRPQDVAAQSRTPSRAKEASTAVGSGLTATASAPPSRRSATVQTSPRASSPPTTLRSALDRSSPAAGAAVGPDKTKSLVRSSTRTTAPYLEGPAPSRRATVPPAPPTASASTLRARPSPAPAPTSPLPRFTTAHLPPFQRHLGAARDLYVELLPSGELLLDPRRRALKDGRKGDAAGEGEVFLFSSDGEEMSVFYPAPLSAPSAPLILVHPIATYTYFALAAVASPSSRPTLAQKRHLKAYRTAAKLIQALRARVPLMSFYHPGALPLPIPNTVADMALQRVKIILFADLDAFACSAGSVSAHVSPARGMVALSMPSAPPSAPASPEELRVEKHALPLAAFRRSPSRTSSSTPSSIAKHAATLAALPPTPAALGRLAAAPDMLALVERVREAHLAALAGASAVLSEPERKRATPSAEEQVLVALERALGPLGAPSPPRRGRRAEGHRSARDTGEARCLSGLGWIVRGRRVDEEQGQETEIEKGKEEQARAWTVLFADGEELRLALALRSAPPAGGAGERVELRWRGERYTLSADVLPTRLSRRLPLVQELVGLFMDG